MIYINVHGKHYRNGAQISITDFSLLKAAILQYGDNINKLVEVTKLSRNTVKKYFFAKVFQKAKQGNPYMNTSSANNRVIAQVNKLSFGRNTNAERVANLLKGKGYITSPWIVNKIRSKTLGLSYKRANRISWRKFLPENQEMRRIVSSQMKEIHCSRLVLIDEVHFLSTNLAPTYAWLPKNKCLILPKRDKGEAFTMCLAISEEGVMHYTLRNIHQEGTFKSDQFFIFFTELVPKLRPHHILFLDNASLHKTDLNIQYMKIKGIKVMYNAPYSPEWNGIELVFGWMKKQLQTHSTSNLSLGILILRVLGRITAELCGNCLEHAYNNCIQNTQ